MMRPTARRLVRVVPRKALNIPEHKIFNRPSPQFEDLQKPTFMDLLMQRKADAGDAWPANLRLEPQLKKVQFKEVEPRVRSALKRLTKER
ncbi:hypothetical protein JR316_0008076 [Psilocybe cubensis]|uniref:Uncharacterized protein n=2 Tax=Psilocybe cubensis TaxID=181762 RepID=A0ACB8GVK5_PSICU|nr:hypothetical protein JR316_0008076 [Psilocybe cubensis]KAH9479482.1 hypothetical protein JR316_0008076 [Psilocybe cubensis]